MISTLSGRQFTRLVARRYNAIASVPLRGKRRPVYGLYGVERMRERERGRKLARESAAPMKGERMDEIGLRGALPLAVCVFNFPGPFCMQISSVIYPRAEARKGETGTA